MNDDGMLSRVGRLLDAGNYTGEMTCIVSTLGSSAFRFEGNVCNCTRGWCIYYPPCATEGPVRSSHKSQHVPKGHIIASEQGVSSSLRIKTAAFPRRSFPLRHSQRQKVIDSYRLHVFPKGPISWHLRHSLRRESIVES